MATKYHPHITRSIMTNYSYVLAPEPEPELDMDRMPAAAEKPNAVASSTSISEHYAKADYVFSETINDRKSTLNEKL